MNAGATPPWTITAGAGNPFFPAGSTITQSASIITAAVYDGHALNPGGDTVTIIGYMQLFIKDVAHHGSGLGQTDDVDAIIMNVTTCGAGGSGQGTGGTVAGSGAGFVPVRLVHP